MYIGYTRLYKRGHAQKAAAKGGATAGGPEGSRGARLLRAYGRSSVPHSQRMGLPRGARPAGRCHFGKGVTFRPACGRGGVEQPEGGWARARSHEAEGGAEGTTRGRGPQNDGLLGTGVSRRSQEGRHNEIQMRDKTDSLPHASLSCLAAGGAAGRVKGQTVWWRHDSAFVAGFWVSYHQVYCVFKGLRGWGRVPMQDLCARPSAPRQGRPQPPEGRPAPAPA
jgi:hypothetical protein